MNDLILAPYARSVGRAARLGGDEGTLTNDERPRDAGTLLVVLTRQVTIYVRCVGTEPRERGHHHPVLESDIAEFDRLKELCGRHRRCWGRVIPGRGFCLWNLDVESPFGGCPFMYIIHQLS